MLNGTNGDTVVGNALDFNSMYGLYLMGAKNTFVADNLVVGNGEGSIYIDSASTGTTLINNWTSTPPVKDGTSGATGSSNTFGCATSNSDSACNGLGW
jgi:parallel beta-helix repeat protein